MRFTARMFPEGCHIWSPKDSGLYSSCMWHGPWITNQLSLAPNILVNDLFYNPYFFVNYQPICESDSSTPTVSKRT